MDSSPNNDGTDQHCQMVRVRQARRAADGKVYVRNRRLNAPQVTQQLESGGSGLQSNAHPLDDNVIVWGTPGLGHVAGREATVKVCGVAVAMLQGHSRRRPRQTVGE